VLLYIKYVISKTIETLVELLKHTIELEETISAIIDKTDIDSKIGLIPPSIDIGGRRAAV
jgi:hypothetical protein